MRTLTYSINVTLDGCIDHREGRLDAEVHQLATEALAQADGLLLGRVTYELMEQSWRPPASDAFPDWMQPFARLGGHGPYLLAGLPRPQPRLGRPSRPLLRVVATMYRCAPGLVAVVRSCVADEHRSAGGVGAHVTQVAARPNGAAGMTTVFQITGNPAPVVGENPPRRLRPLVAS